MKNLVAKAFLSGVISALYFSGPADLHAQELKFGCLMAAALPDCPPVAHINWWVGSWATRMASSSDTSLTAYTLLKNDGSYRSTLEYDDGRKVEHWGHYKIDFPNGKSSIKRTSVAVKEEAIQIDRSVRSSTVIRRKVVDLMAAAIPEEGSECDCASGRITYYVEGSEPELNFQSPQVFRFVQQAEYGYVRLWGPGVEGSLGRLYARQ